MLRTKRQGFTLIELMVVIVIIGVLSTLAIPRFTAISDKAKMGEAPKIIANFESAYLATQVQHGSVSESESGEENALMFTIPKSTIFKYKEITDGSDNLEGLLATSDQKIGRVAKGAGILGTKYDEEKSEFKRCLTDENDDREEIMKMVPNFVDASQVDECEA